MRRLFRKARDHDSRAGEPDHSGHGSLTTPPPVPFLPSSYGGSPRAINPDGNASSSADVAASSSSPSSLGLFARLPPELRRRVLLDAFGERTLHLDLRLVPGSRGDYEDNNNTGGAGAATPAAAIRQFESEHGRGLAPLGDGMRVAASRVEAAAAAAARRGQNGGKRDPSRATRLFRMARSKEKQPARAADDDGELGTADCHWRWYGCVCHRLVPRGSAIEARLTHPYVWPHRDECLRGRAVMCQFWSSSSSSLSAKPGVLCDCGIGALGWLRACRQAYLEGAEVLYGTNTFVLESGTMLDALLVADPGPHQRLLPPRHLAAITALELRCDVLLFGDDDSSPQSLPRFAALGAVFPHLRSLIVSFSDALYRDRHAPPETCLDKIDARLLQPLARAFEPLMPRLVRPLIVELPENVFKVLDGLDLDGETRDDEPGPGRGRWLKIPVGEDSRSFYLVKPGEESDMFWDSEGRGRLASSTYVPDMLIRS